MLGETPSSSGRVSDGCVPSLMSLSHQNERSNPMTTHYTSSTVEKMINEAVKSAVEATISRAQGSYEDAVSEVTNKIQRVLDNVDTDFEMDASDVCTDDPEDIMSRFASEKEVLLTEKECVAREEAAACAASDGMTGVMAEELALLRQERDNAVLALRDVARIAQPFMEAVSLPFTPRTPSYAATVAETHAVLGNVPGCQCGACCTARVALYSPTNP